MNCVNTKPPLNILIAILLLIFLTPGCKNNDPGDPGENEVFLQYKNYKPSQIIIKEGTTVTFISKDNATHTVSSASNIFDSGAIKAGESFSYTFTTKGNYNIFCKSHAIPSEQGTVVVQ